ncbi:thioredoxin-dependent thiol peroxidase [Saccharibacillus endophyticus]|uniref:thioredoxin-dependent peroxiredoxin n=1 Tax=Saccharibacillus endophyticus TaxID=2060666 RepID=A0ABQ1ZZH9_9BACL|nr:thioredoxin-dependent thiol peroxidase [Saccharibacillus endophyticus]GGH81269.1 putative peroxiredoxin YgaF [Saccharibacillus endophyticus]
MVQLNEKVQDFTLPAVGGQSISLSDYKGKKLVIYFYPKDMTPGCTQQACDFRDSESYFTTKNAAVIGISADDVKSHEKFGAKYELPFPLLSDTEHAVSEQFGVWQVKKNFGKEYEGIVRSTFLIDEEGTLVREWRKVKVAGHVDEVLQALES